MILGTSPIASNLHTGTLINFFVFVGPADLRNRRGGTRNDPERWKLECTNDIRKDSVNRSRSTLKGRISEQMPPLLPEFPFASADARFIGNPIDRH